MNKIVELLKWLVLALLAAILPLFTSCGKDTACVEKVKSDCFCTYQYDPVCGCNDKTYGNSCIALCSGIKDFIAGPCASDCTEIVNPNCFCIEIYDPVCGCNNKTYSNSCHAECNGIKTYSPGVCPQ